MRKLLPFCVYYSQWFGTAFKALACYEALPSTLRQALLAENEQERERLLCVAYEFVGQKGNKLGITDWVEPTVRPFHDRPFKVIDVGRFATTVYQTMAGEVVHQISSAMGSID